MKTKTFKHIIFIAILIFLAACSTRKDTFLARNSHALTTRYNILYNGQIALDKGIESLKSSKKDNFWTRLPIERMQFNDENSPGGSAENADFEFAETKATKAIQKHSMNIGGQEKNYQMDEAYLLLGKARYYDQRFFPALEAFNYILYKYPTSSNILQAKIWREKTNMRLGNDTQVLKNISKQLDDKKLKHQVVADANALLAESFLNFEEKDSAIAKLKIATIFTKNNNEKARYRFILGQLYQELGKKDTALIYFQSVIDMNRKAEREYVIQAHAKKAQLFDFKNGNPDTFVETYNKLIADRENRPFLDILYYQVALFYDNNNDQKLAKEFYNSSLRAKSLDSYLTASAYRNLGDMNFKNTDYATAAKYYDSTLVKLNPKTREYIHIKKVRKDLNEVIEFESIAKINDSILNLVSLSDKDRILYFEKHIGKLKKVDEAKKLLEEEQKKKQENIERNSLVSSDNPDMPRSRTKTPSIGTSSTGGSTSNIFYFYNPTTVAFGKVEFRKKWGNRALEGNWRLSDNKTKVGDAEPINTNNLVPEEQEEIKDKPQYTTSFYIDQLPKKKTEIDSISKERNVAYYQLGVIYKEKFKEYALASKKLEQLLQNNPDEKLVLPTMYNLFKIYQITNNDKAQDMKRQISSQYPDSRYAQIINNTNPSTVTEKETTEAEYNKWYKLFLEEQFGLVLEKIDGIISQYYGDEIVPKFELLKANSIGKLRGLEAYKKAIQFVAVNYPTSEEGKNAQEILTTQIPLLEAMNFTSNDTKNWKILYKIAKQDDKTAKEIGEKIKKFGASENIAKLTYTVDVYTEKENFITISGIKSESYAQNVASVWKEDTKYKIAEPAVVITNENYKIVQIKKNLTEYSAQSRGNTTAVQQEVPPATNPNIAPNQSASTQGNAVGLPPTKKDPN